MKASFGPFTFETTTRELRHDGEIVKLQSQPAHVLAVLVEHAGEIVTRETLRQAVWGDDTFVDFDKGLNFAIAQVRTALGDSAESPAFIRTFPKRGYQFIGPVPDRRTKVLRHFLLPAAAIVIALVAGAIWLSARRSANPAHTIAVIRFDNQTGIADYDRYAQDLTDAVVAELTTTGIGRFAVIGNAAALRMPRDRRDLVAIGEQLRAGYIVLGQVQREGEKLRVLAHLIRLPEQKHLWVTRVEGAPSDQATTPAALAERVSREFLDKL